MARQASEGHPWPSHERRRAEKVAGIAPSAWNNAKKLAETELNAKGTELHASAVVGDTVGDPFKDTSSVAMNPIIKFTTLFGLLAVELAVTLQNGGLKGALAAAFLMVAFVFVYRSFYGMRIPVDAKTETKE
ncbi:MAG: sodium/proton-translocating pyrophosphatase [Deltaproteobacteria bacterium]|nr:sodium/proton-translocating pyrophosphatase [Deltaproteobacteria bacterium]